MTRGVRFSIRRSIAVGGCSLAALVGGTACPAAAALTGAATASSYWQLCAYALDGAGNKIGSACSHNNEARVCDLKADGRGISGDFGVRYEGVYTFSDANGSASPCAYRYDNHNVTSASAYVSS